MIVGSAYFDFATNKPIENPDPGVYVSLLIINLVVTLLILSFYLWKYEQKHPIIEDKWAKDAVILGLVICLINFLLDALFFGMMGRNLLIYFFLESTTGYMYPAIILETLLLAYIIYGRKQ